MSESDREKPLDGLTQQWALIALLCSLPIFFLFAHMGDPGRGRAAATSAGIVILAARARWDLRRFVWFWITIAIMAGLHIPFIVLIAWSVKSYPGYALMPVGVLDLGLYYGCIALVEKAVTTTGPKPEG